MARIHYTIMQRDGDSCCWCGMRLRLPGTNPVNFGREATLEHLRPRRLGGGDHVENLAVACEECNTKRGPKVGPPPTATQYGWATRAWQSGTRWHNDPSLVHPVSLPPRPPECEP